MYPFSWLGAAGAAGPAGPGHDPASTALQTPPDVIVVVGDSTSSSRQFAGHRAVLTAHSGFFKGALATRTASPTSICVPSVFPEAFGPLLSFMYTGYLDITPDNIYTVLLATHYLHMPRALDLCWAYLRQNQLLPALPALPAVPTRPLVKPIPSRGKVPALTWHQPSALNTILSTAEHSPFRSVCGQAAPGSGPDSGAGPSPDNDTVDEVSDDVADEPIDVDGPPPFHPTTPMTPSPTFALDPRSPGSPAPRSSAQGSPMSSHIPVTVDSPSPPLQRQSPDIPSPPLRQISSRETNPSHPELPEAASQEGQSTTSASQSSPRTRTPSDPPPQPAPHATASPSFAHRPASSKVVIDVACCDGPVRFHRVLNQSYGLGDAAVVECVEDIVSEDAVDENQVTTRRVRLPGAGQLRRARAERLAAAAAVAVEGSTGCTSPLTRSRPHSATASDSHIDYTCLYCNHTFKSHYCYQKHASRHLNPVSPKGVVGHVKGSPSPIKPKVQPSAASSHPRPAAGREAVRPLDMNVQYYPCKTCGSKFPSYYFVHKHRKMCHLSETSPSSGQNQPSSSEGSARSPQDTTSS